MWRLNTRAQGGHHGERWAISMGSKGKCQELRVVLMGPVGLDGGIRGVEVLGLCGLALGTRAAQSSGHWLDWDGMDGD